MSATGHIRPRRLGPPEPSRELVPLRRLIVPHPLCWFRLGIADRPLVRRGQHVSAGDPLLERVRDPRLAELPLPRGIETPEPLTPVQRPSGDPTDTPVALHAEGPGRVLHAEAGRRVRVAVGRVAESILTPVAGTVTVLEPGAIGIRVEGTGIAGVVAHGDTVRGRLRLLVATPDAELRPSAVDVQGAGAILVAGAGLDVEALTRARATGVAGIVCGGIAGKDLATLAAADVRQRASLHPTSAFGVLVVDGYGRRPIPRAAWDWLVAAEGTEAGIVHDPPMLVVGPRVEPPESTDDVRIAAGEALGAEGRLLGSAGQTRSPSGLYRPMARILVPGVANASSIEHLVAFADLERVE